MAKYKNVNRQICIRQFLHRTTLFSIMDKDSCDLSTALEKLCDTVTSYVPQGPISNRSEEAKVEYLYYAVSSIDWAKLALTQCYTHEPSWDFYKIYTALDAFWLNEQREAKKRQATNSIFDAIFRSQPTHGNARRSWRLFEKYQNIFYNKKKF